MLWVPSSPPFSEAVLTFASGTSSPDQGPHMFPLQSKGNTFILSCMASLMILFMMDQSYYPHDEILESESWKKIVYLGGK